MTCLFTFPCEKAYNQQLQEKQRTYSRHRSLADHLGNSSIDDALTCPARLSEDIIRCISSIYCKLANTMGTEKGCSVSSTSSFCSSSTFSPRNLSGSWSPQCNEEVTQSCDFDGPKQENGPYAAMVEVLKLCLDDESYSYAAVKLQKFRYLILTSQECVHAQNESFVMSVVAVSFPKKLWLQLGLSNLMMLVCIRSYS